MAESGSPDVVEHVEADDASDESDWDADPDLVDDFKMYMQNQPDYYTMHASGGMVTITPATSKTQIVAAPIEVEVEWTYGGNEVFVYTSFDDFQTAIPLEGKVDEITDELHHVGTVLLPPGRYLIRYLVDGEWMVDDNQEVVCSLGNEYNSILVEDPNCPEPDSSDDDTTRDDDWNDLDEHLPDNFKSGSSADLFGGKTIDTSKGMVNISPDTFKDLESLSAEEKAKIKQAGDMDAVEGRRTSLVWDSHKRAFVIAKADQNENEAELDDTKSELTEPTAAAAAADDGKKEKDRKRKKQKKKRQKEKKRKHQQRNLFTSGGNTAAGRARGQSKSADIAAIKEEIVKREREWREAWILHELKTQEEREKEKESMRAQWKEEREQWILKIKTYSTEAHNTRQFNSELHRQLDEAKSDIALKQAAFQREQEKFMEQQKLVEDELKNANQQIVTLREQVASIREQHNASVDSNNNVLKDLENSKTAARAEIDALRASESKYKLGLDEARRELQDAQHEKKALEEQQHVKNKEWEAKLESVKKDYELKSQQSSAALNEATQTLEKHLNTRVQELNGVVEEKSKQLDEVREQLTAVQKQLAESKRETQALQGQFDAQLAALEQTKKDRASTEAEAQALTAKIEQLNKERKELETSSEATRSDLEMQVNKLKASLLHKQKKMDDAVAELEKFKSDSQLKEQEFEREREENKRLLERAQTTSANLREKVTVVVNNAQAIRATMSGFKEQTLKEVTALKSGLEDSKKFLLNSINMQSQLLNATMKKYKKELSERRKYFNMVQELKGNIRVFCRCRPFIEEDQKKGLTNAATFPEESTIRIATEKKDHDFEFDKVFGPDSTQTDVFSETKALVTSCMDGYNVCIFAYGQTGSGKTFTMDGPPEDRGVNYRALTELFAVRDERSEDFEYKISVSMLEIYNETIRDLLSEDKQTDEKSLKVHKGPQGMYVEGLTEWEVTNEQDVINAIVLGRKNRATGITNMNEHSSRSHSLLSVKVEGYNRTAGMTYFGKLHLIDLAGSERVGKSGATGDRLKEAQAINKSLSALGNVIEALQKKASHVPYRNSKLTFLLQDSLGGHAKTLMFINVSPTASDSEETVCSLTFASRVARVELGGAVRNTGAAEPVESKGDEPAGDDAEATEDAGADDGAAPAATAAAAPATPAKPAAAAKPAAKPSATAAAAKPAAKPAAAAGARVAKSTTPAPAKKPAAPVKKP